MISLLRRLTNGPGIRIARTPVFAFKSIIAWGTARLPAVPALPCTFQRHAAQNARDRRGPGSAHARTRARHSRRASQVGKSGRPVGCRARVVRQNKSPAQTGDAGAASRENVSRGSPPLDAPTLSQGTNQARRRSRWRSRRAYGKRCIAPIIAIVQAAPKTVTKIRSPRPNARPKPRPASRESAISSRKRGAICTLFAN